MFPTCDGCIGIDRRYDGGLFSSNIVSLGLIEGTRHAANGIPCHSPNPVVRNWANSIERCGVNQVPWIGQKGATLIRPNGHPARAPMHLIGANVANPIVRIPTFQPRLGGNRVSDDVMHITRGGFELG